jgi:hypothetical protein
VLEEMWLERLQPYNEKGYNKRKEVNWNKAEMIVRGTMKF